MRYPKAIATRYSGAPGIADAMGIYSHSYSTDSQEILWTMEGIFRPGFARVMAKDVTGVSCRIENGDYTEVWVCYEPRPYATDSTWERVR